MKFITEEKESKKKYRYTKKKCILSPNPQNDYFINEVQF